MSKKKTPTPSKENTKRGTGRKNRWEAEASDLRISRIISNLTFWVAAFVIATLLGIVISQQVKIGRVF